MMKTNTFFTLLVLAVCIGCFYEVSEQHHHFLNTAQYKYQISSPNFESYFDTIYIAKLGNSASMYGIEQMNQILKVEDNNIYSNNELLFPLNAKIGDSWSKNDAVRVTYSGDVEINGVETKSLIFDFNRNVLFEINFSLNYGIVRYSSSMLLIEMLEKL